MFILNTNSGPTSIVNRGDNYIGAYPENNFGGYNALPESISKFLAAASGNINYGIVDNTVIETVGGTQINGYFKTTIEDSFISLGNYYLSTDFGTTTELGTGHTAGTSFTGGPHTFSQKVRYVSLEKLAAGKAVGANVNLASMMRYSGSMGGGSGTTAGTITNAVTEYIVKLMATNGTLTTIGTVTTAASSTISFSTPVVQSNTTNGTLTINYGTFTPQISNLGDRIVIEIKISGSITYSSGATGGGTVGIYTGFGYTGTNRGLADYLSCKPIQISVT